MTTTPDSPDFRALCAELIDKIDYTWSDILLDVQLLVDRARAALATPPPEPPTDEELLHKYGEAKRNHCYEGDPDDWPKKAERAATVAGLRAVLERWGK